MYVHIPECAHGLRPPARKLDVGVGPDAAQRQRSMQEKAHSRDDDVITAAV
jgi:hypothetical protein